MLFERFSGDIGGSELDEFLTAAQPCDNEECMDGKVLRDGELDLCPRCDGTGILDDTEEFDYES